MRHTVKIILCALASGIIVNDISAQNKIRFSSTLEQSLLLNKDNKSAAIQSVNGVSYDNWIVGVGVAVDFYRYITIPVFLDVRKEFGKQRNKPFVYVDGGLNIYADAHDAEYKNGGYFAGGLGYALHFKKKQAVLFSAGYSYKGHKAMLIYMGKPPDFNEYNFNRYALKVGWGF